MKAASQCSESSPAADANDSSVEEGGWVSRASATGCVDDCNAPCKSESPAVLTGTWAASLRISRKVDSMFEAAVLASIVNRCSGPKREPTATANSVARERASESVRIRYSKSASGMYKSEV